MSETYLPSKKETDGFGQYLKDIGRYKLFTPEEELKYSSMVYDMVSFKRFLKEKGLQSLSIPELAEVLQSTEVEINNLYREGEYGRQKMVNHNLRLVVCIAKRYNNRGVDLTDLVQEGNIGLSKAVYKFNPNLGYKFSTYSTWWIRQAIARAVATNNRKIRLPMHIYDILNKVKRVSRELSQVYGRHPSTAEVAEHIGIKKDKLLKVASYCRKVLSLDAPFYDSDDPDISISQFLGDHKLEKELNTRILRDRIDKMMENLTDNEKYVLTYRYGLNESKIYTFKDLSDIMGLTLDKVKRLKGSAFEKLRAICTAEGIDITELGI